MSINDFMNKIKVNLGIDKVDILYLFIIIGVGICSFFLGKLSNMNNIKSTTNNKIAIEQVEAIKNNDIENTEIKKKNFVASKNGKMYYSLGCSGAKRIKTENEIWFNTKEEAEKSGYSLSTTCK